MAIAAFAINTAWVTAVALAIDLLCWTRRLLLDGPLAKNRRRCTCGLDNAADNPPRPELSVAAVASRSGFDSPSSFSRACRSRFGVAPREGRRRFAAR